MPKLTNSYIQELLTVGPFDGLDASTGQYFVDGGMATDLLNVVPDRKYKSYITVQGRKAALAANLPSGGVSGMVKFLRQNSGAVYLASAVTGAAQKIYQFALAGSPAALTLPTGATWNATGSASFTPYQQANTTPAAGWMFASNGVDTPLKIDTALNVTLWQAAPPSGAPAVATSGAGNVNSTAPYYYRYTYSNATLETSPSPISAAITGTSNAILISGFTASTDPQITQLNIYRLGGSLGTWFLVSSIATGVATFTDNIADVNLTGQSLVLHRDPPPTFNSVFTHKDRVWGFGYNNTYNYQFNSVTNAYTTGGPQPSDLWYSNYTEPWGFDNTNQVLPIGRNAGGDVGVTGCSLGSVAFALKTRSAWGVYGDTQSDFLARRLFGIGISSAKSLAVGYDIAFWVSNRAQIWAFDGSEPLYLSKDIQRLLDAFTQADLNAAVGFMHERMYWVSFPTQQASFGYHLDTQKWFKIGWSCDNAVYDPDNLNEVTATENGTGIVDSWFAAETDLTLAIVSSFTSKIADSGALSATKQYRYAVIQAPVQSGATATVELIVDPGLNQKTQTKSVNLALSPPRHLISMTPNMVGFEAQLIVTITSSQQTEVQRVATLGYVKRQLVSAG